MRKGELNDTDKSDLSGSDMERYPHDVRKEFQIRRERLKKIRDLVAKGEYRVDPEKVAAKLIQDGLEFTAY
ncbi:MAG: hypothetical protein GTO00_09530 [Deltaproteobacteria bacterium]|nr:hypothetical protein [Deltaproteobacteria bacterium]